MSKNPQKSRCRVEGCRAWAMRGKEYCSAHRYADARARRRSTQPAGRQPPVSQGEREPASTDQVSAVEALQRLRALIERLAREPLEDVAVLDQELRNLFAVRALFLRWLEPGQNQEPEGVDAAQFLRTWNDSSTRVMQLLRTRRQLVGSQEGEWGPFMQDVFDGMEERVPIFQQEGEAQGATAPPDEEKIDGAPGTPPAE
ncbi:MAG: hypothetical protein GX552_08300 [Chloroflexi bacterium]|jgi:hypothetical protein|nr:hypothetical protein [Chloroflexota bacterium]